MTIRRTIQKYLSEGGDEHHRYRSWEHCYGYFRSARETGLDQDRERAMLHLAFYLASWGMYRGSSFLLQKAYTVHGNMVGVLGERRFDELWEADLGGDRDHEGLVPTVRDLINAVREAYAPFAPKASSRQPTDTLITKVILGTFGVLPACDRYLIVGMRLREVPYSGLNDLFIHRMISFCRTNLSELREEQQRLAGAHGVHYPLMKLVDMHFWQLGFEENSQGSTP